MAALDVGQTYGPCGCCRTEFRDRGSDRLALCTGTSRVRSAIVSVEGAARKSAHLAGRRLNVIAIQSRYGLATGSGFGCSASEFR